MVNRDTMGVSLLESSYYDIRDNFLFDVDVKSFKEGIPSTGSGPSQKFAIQRKNSREIQYAKQRGKDILKYGIFSSRNNNRDEIKETDGCNPPTKEIQTEVEYMIQKRLNTARESEHIFKISKISIVNDSKRIYTVLGSPNGRKNYEVTVCCSPSCTCPDYKKNGKKVLCKHMFTFLRALKLEEKAFLSQNIHLRKRTAKSF